VGPITIRDARPVDVDALRELYRRASLSNEGDRANLLANPDVLEWAADSVAEGRTRVAVLDDRVVGFVTTIVADELEIDDLFVDPDRMRQGVGRALVEDVTELARTRGGRRIAVTANEHALAFYEAMGFVSEGFVDTLFGSSPRMFLALDAAPGG
jgi:GNAT superfamily N-acetyltransferase